MDRSSWARGSTAGTSLGFIARNTDRLQVIPYASVVYSWFGTRVLKVAPGSPPVGGYLAGPANQQHRGWNNSWATSAFTRTNRVWAGALVQKLLIGIRVGYLTPLNRPSWQTNDRSLSRFKHPFHPVNDLR